MAEIVLSVSILVVAALVAMSLAFGRRVPPDARLPMQWGFDGRPTWYARRNLALAFTPALAALVMGLVVVTATLAAARGQVWGAAIAGFAFIAAHGLHLVLAGRWLRSHPTA